MKKNTANNLLIILCLLVALAGCKAKKQLVASRKADSTAAVASTTHTAIMQVKSAQLSFNTFSAKAKAKLTINDKSNDVSLNIRILSGKKIWISVTALLGLEVARAVITPDSMLVVDRFDGVYIKKPFSYIYKYANKEVTYKMLEAFFVGNAAPELLKDDVTIKPNAAGMELNGNLEQLVYKLVLGPDKKVNLTNIVDPEASRTLDVKNVSFVQAGQRVVPSEVVIQSEAAKSKILMDIRYSKTDFDMQLEYPFSIPEDYKAQN